MRVVVTMLVLTLGLALNGCGGDDSDSSGTDGGASTAAGVPDADGNVPFEVLRRAVMAANSGDFDGAKSWVIPDSAMGTNPMGVDLLPRKWPPYTHNGQVANVEFISDGYHGQEATVKYRLHFNDGSTFQEEASLAKHEGRWKLTFMTAEAMF